MPSNKGETQGENTQTCYPATTPGPIGDLTAPLPFIDRLSVMLHVPDTADARDIHKAVWSNHDAHQDYEPMDKKLKGFKSAWKLKLPSLIDSKHWPYLAYDHDKDGQGRFFAKRLRLEFVPVDLGPAGMAELNAFLTSNVDGGWAYFLKHGHITRLDVAVDMPTLTMEDFHYLHPQGLSIKEWRQDGMLRTFSVGKLKGNQTMVYDRGAKRQEKNSAKPGKVGVRVERRIRKINFPLKQLVDFKNPLEDFMLIERWPGPPAGEAKAYIWNLFMAAANQTSMTEALALLTDGKKAMYRKHLKAHAKPWWQPEESWKHWPVMLKELGLVP